MIKEEDMLAYISMKMLTSGASRPVARRGSALHHLYLDTCARSQLGKLMEHPTGITNSMSARPLWPDTSFLLLLGALQLLAAPVSIYA
jgi:hypothetical protein